MMYARVKDEVFTIKDGKYLYDCKDSQGNKWQVRVFKSQRECVKVLLKVHEKFGGALWDMQKASDRHGWNRTYAEKDRYIGMTLFDDGGAYEENEMRMYRGILQNITIDNWHSGYYWQINVEYGWDDNLTKEIKEFILNV